MEMPFMDCCRIKLFESTVYERYRIYFSVSPSFPSSWHLLFKVNNQNTRKMRGFYSELKIKNPLYRFMRCCGVFVVNFK